MPDHAIGTLEESLWTGDAARYRELVDGRCVMVLPSAPFIRSGTEAIDAVSETPRWSGVTFSKQRSAQASDDLVVIAYHARGERGGASGYEAYCTSTWHRFPGQEWRVVQHQQLPPIVASAT